MLIDCACGCGLQREKRDKYGIIRKFIKGHNAWKTPHSVPTIRNRKEYIIKNRYKYYVNAIENRRQRKIEAIIYMGGKCKKCGYEKCNRALTFHHKNRQEKEYNISKILDYSWDKLKLELDKCILLCMNCHAEAEECYEKNKIRISIF